MMVFMLLLGIQAAFGQFATLTPPASGCAYPAFSLCATAATPCAPNWFTSHGTPEIVPTSTMNSSKVISVSISKKENEISSTGFYYEMPAADATYLKGRVLRIEFEARRPSYPFYQPTTLLRWTLGNVLNNSGTCSTYGDFQGFAGASLPVGPVNHDAVLTSSLTDQFQPFYREIYVPPSSNFTKIAFRTDASNVIGNFSIYTVQIKNIKFFAADCTLPLTISASPKTTICKNSGDTVCLTANTSILGCTFKWSNGTTAPTICVTPNLTTVYTVTATSPNGCTKTATQKITVAPIPIVSIAATPRDTICKNSRDTVCLTANTSILGCTFNWSNGANTPTICVTPNVTTVYTVTVTSPDGCVGTSTQQITVTPNTLQANVSVTGNTCIVPPGAVLAANVTSPNTSPYVYKWNTGETSPSITTNTPGEYTVTITDAQGCKAVRMATASGAIDVTINNQAATAIISANGTATLTATCTPTTPNVEYLWNTGERTQTITVTQHGTYTVTATVLLGQNQLCMDTATIYVERPACMNLPGYTVIGRTGDSTFLSTLINASVGGLTPAWLTNDPNIPFRVPNGTPAFKWLIRGKLIFDMSSTFTNVDFKMCDDAAIQMGKYTGVTPKPYFSSDIGGYTTGSSLIEGIDRMWEGITILDSSLVELVSDAIGDFIIRDAKIGIKVHYGGRLATKASDDTNNSRVRFENNNIGVFYAGRNTNQTPITPSNTGGSVISSTDFINTATLKPPMAGLWGETGIIINDRPDIRLSAFIATPLSTIGTCTFQHLRYGIKAKNARIRNYYQLSFSDIDNFNPSSGSSDATAIWLEGNSEWGHISSANYEMTIRGARRGIFLNNSSGVFDTVTIGTDPATARPTLNGIEIQRCNALQKITVERCNITAAERGIFSWQNNGATITIGNLTDSTKGNRIQVGGNATVSRKGISVAENSGTITPYTIGYNKITVAGAHRAMQISNTSNTLIYKNRITGSGMQTGLFLVACNAASIQENFIGNTAASPGNAAIHAMRLKNCKIQCNTTANTMTGIYLRDITAANTLETNELKNHNIGLDYSPTVTIALGDQINSGNRFTGNYTIAAARNQAVTIAPGGNFVVPGQILTQQFDGTNTSTFWGGAANKQMIGQNTVIDWFANSFAPQPSCNNPHFTGNGGNTIGITNAEDIALGLTKTPMYGEEMDYASKKALYEKLLAEPDNLANSPILQQFADSLAMTATADLIEFQRAAVLNLGASGQLQTQLNDLNSQIATLEAQVAVATDSVQLENLTALLDANYAALKQADAAYQAALELKVDALQQQNAAIQPTLLQDVNQKIVNDISLRQFTKSPDTADLPVLAGDSLVLATIANTCPYTGGSAVFDARSILAAYTSNADYDDDAICLERGIAYRRAPNAKNAPTNLNSVKAYPNPAGTYLVVETNEPTAAGAIILTDMLGKIVQVNAWNKGNTRQLIYLEGVASGIYSLKLHTDDQDFLLQKIAVVHP